MHIEFSLSYAQEFFLEGGILAKKAKTLAELEELAESYGVADNALFKSAIEQYKIQVDVLKKIKSGISKTYRNEKSLLTSKEYVKGRENISVNPLVKELPKHSDALNKTSAQIIYIIETFGSPPEKKNALDDFKKEFEIS